MQNYGSPNYLSSVPLFILITICFPSYYFCAQPIQFGCGSLSFFVNLLEKDHAKRSTPFPISDAALGSKVLNDYQERCFISQDEINTTSVSRSRIDNYHILHDPLFFFTNKRSLQLSGGNVVNNLFVLY